MKLIQKVFPFFVCPTSGIFSSFKFEISSSWKHILEEWDSSRLSIAVMDTVAFWLVSVNWMINVFSRCSLPFAFFKKLRKSLYLSTFAFHTYAMFFVFWTAFSTATLFRSWTGVGSIRCRSTLFLDGFYVVSQSSLVTRTESRYFFSRWCCFQMVLLFICWNWCTEIYQQWKRTNSRCHRKDISRRLTKFNTYFFALNKTFFKIFNR